MNRKSLPSVLVVALLALSFLGFFVVVPSVHAQGVLVAQADALCYTGVTTCAITHTISSYGDLLVVGIAPFQLTNLPVTFTIADSKGNAWSNSGLNSVYCSNWVGSELFWTVVSSSTGSDTITVTASGTTHEIDSASYEFAGAANVKAAVGTGVTACGGATASSTSATAYTAGLGQTYVAVASTPGTGGGQAPGSGFTCYTGYCNLDNYAGMEYSVGTIASPVTFAFSASVSPWAITGVVFVNTGPVTTTSFINAAAFGNCGVPSASAVTLANSTEYYYEALPNALANVQNVTVWLAGTGAATVDQTLYVGLYLANDPGPVSSANPLQLASALSFNVAHGTHNHRYMVNPTTLSPFLAALDFAPNQYMAIGVVGSKYLSLNLSTASNSQDYTAPTGYSGVALAPVISTQTTTSTAVYLCTGVGYVCPASGCGPSYSRTTITQYSQPVSTLANCFLCQNSPAASVDALGISFGLPLAAWHWILVFILVLVFAGAGITLVYKAPKAIPFMVVVMVFCALGVSVAFGWLDWIYFAGLVATGAGVGIGRAMHVI